MKAKTIALAGVFCVVSALVLAARHDHSWSGFMVDLSCYVALERNNHPIDTEEYVNRDRDRDVRSCSPKPATKSFALVDHDGLIYPLDATGNTKAAGLVTESGKNSPLQVTVKGAMGTDSIHVGSISPKK